MNHVLYQRELNRSYMVLESGCGDLADRYEYRMMAENRIGRLLPCSLRQLDGKSCLYYDISSRQPIGRLFESRKLGIRDLAGIVHAVSDIQEDLSEYLMDEQGLLLAADTLFADIETEELYFCYDPSCRHTGHRYTGLADFFLEHVDHGQESAVNAAYRFYKMAKEDGFVLSSFLPYLDRELHTPRAPEQDAWQGVPADRPCAQYAQCAPPGPEKERETASGPKEAPVRRSFFSLPALFRKSRFFPRQKKADRPPLQRGPEPQPRLWDSCVEQIDDARLGDTLFFPVPELPLRDPEGTPCLREMNTGRRILLEKLPVTVGRLQGKADILLTDGSVSRLHARFETADDGLLVRDLNSRNGTAVNGCELTPNETARLKDGDLLRFGRERFQYGFLDSKSIK